MGTKSYVYVRRERDKLKCEGGNNTRMDGIGKLTK